MTTEFAPITPLEWMSDALCAQTVDGDLWFPEPGGSVLPAKRICAACPVASLCLLYAIENDITIGTFGGLSARERRTLKERAS